MQTLFAAGADDYVPKPIVAPELLTRITNRVERVALYRSLSDVDALTGVATRRAATEALERLLALSRRELPLALAVIDLDVRGGLRPACRCRDRRGRPGAVGSPRRHPGGRPGWAGTCSPTAGQPCPVVTALELGAFDHVAKPFSLPILMQRVRRALESMP